MKYTNSGVTCGAPYHLAVSSAELRLRLRAPCLLLLRCACLPRHATPLQAYYRATACRTPAAEIERAEGGGGEASSGDVGWSGLWGTRLQEEGLLG
jgi:hypothetical protein